MALVESPCWSATPRSACTRWWTVWSAIPSSCPGAGAPSVEYRDGQVTRASIRIDYRGIHQSFRTENRTQPRRTDRDPAGQRPIPGPGRDLALHRARRGRVPHRLPAALRILEQAAGAPGRAGIPLHRQQLRRCIPQARREALRELSRHARWKSSTPCRWSRTLSHSMCAAGATVGEALAASGMLARHPDIDLRVARVGVWGRLCDARRAPARGRPRGDLPPAAGRSQGGPAAPRRQQASDRLDL